MDEFFEKMQELMEIYRSGRNKKRKKIWDYHAKDTNIPCGDEVELFLEVDHDVIVDASFDGKGCLVSQVSASLLIDHIKGKSIKEIEEIDESTIKQLLALELSPTRMRCATLPLRVLKESLNRRYILSSYPSDKGDVVGVVDKNLLGKYYEEDGKVLDLSSPFYKGSEVTFKEVIKALDKCYTANVVGNNIVKELISYGMVNKENVKKIKGIMYIHIYRIE